MVLEIEKQQMKVEQEISTSSDLPFSIKSKLSQLCTGLLLLTIKKEINEPSYSALDILGYLRRDPTYTLWGIFSPSMRFAYSWRSRTYWVL